MYNVILFFFPAVLGVFEDIIFSKKHSLEKFIYIHMHFHLDGNRELKLVDKTIINVNRINVNLFKKKNIGF